MSKMPIPFVTWNRDKGFDLTSLQDVDIYQYTKKNTYCHTSVSKRIINRMYVSKIIRGNFYSRLSNRELFGTNINFLIVANLSYIFG